MINDTAELNYYLQCIGNTGDFGKQRALIERLAR